MIEALWYGLIVSLSFIGFVAVLVYFLLHIYSLSNDSQLIFILPDNLTISELYKSLYGIYLRKFFGENITKDTLIILNNQSDILSVCEMCDLKDLCSNFECLTYDELINRLRQED